MVFLTFNSTESFNVFSIVRLKVSYCLNLSILKQNGEIDFSNAYDTGIGDWDKVTVAYSYSDVPKGMKEKKYLRGILTNAFINGLQYISDADARPQGSAHAKAHLWDNGENTSEELESVLAIRNQAIENFSIDNKFNDLKSQLNISKKKF